MSLFAAALLSWRYFIIFAGNSGEIFYSLRSKIDDLSQDDILAL
jgi:hypothetical protein